MAAHLPNLPIAIDARLLGGAGMGAGSYARAVAVALEAAGIAPQRVTDDFPVTRAKGVAERVRRWLVTLLDRTVAVDERLHARDVFRRAQVHFDRHGTLLRLRAPGAPGMMHWTYPLPIRIEGWVNLYTVHDVIPLTHPELTPIDPLRHRRLLEAIAREGGRLLTVSAAARAEIAAATGLEAIDAAGAVAPVGDEPAPDGLASRGYLLFCGTVEPRKNVARLIEAWRRSGTTLPLVIAGPDGWRAGEAGADAPGIVRLRGQSAAQIGQLQRHARALLFPSLAEGFGLPIAEAIARGTPVMTSAGGATEEVAGGAALLVDPDDVAAMAAAIGRLATDDALCADLAARGLARAAAFTPERFGARLLAAYAAAIASASPGH